ncbi:hypothetical protein [Enterobacter cloacae complex sp. P24RS]|uniref:hypothetical protein n=1 Tax=Enterobacter cloacae complex sp. P24RS TaxID=2779568 RepID=UPI001876DD4D|nr:hypothetical protein [Enterobacter cloacae complex sp. P24RS]MBE4963937.1 hypothetical protein [Enterobacter cloacae complex sp. P24RS]
MKPIKRLYLSTDEIHLADASLVLELNSCGRGFITAGTTQDYTGKLVRLDVGYVTRSLAQKALSGCLLQNIFLPMNQRRGKQHTSTG